MSKFSVSLPDVKGAARQVGGLGSTYEALAQAMQSTVFTTNSDNVLATIPSVEQDSPLTAGLSKFSVEFFKYLEVIQSRTQLLGGEKGLGRTSANLLETVEEYKDQEDEALKELESADPGSDEAKEAKKVADSIDHGEANSDWSARISVADFLPGEYSGFNYRNKSSRSYEEEYEQLSDAERIMEQVMEQSPIGTIDAILEWILGYSPVKQWITPLIVGDWGYLWYLGDYFGGAGNVSAEVTTVLSKGADTLLAGDWTGPAAEAYKYHASESWGGYVLTQYKDNVNDAADLFNQVGNAIEAAGVKLAPIIIALGDIVLSIISRNAGKVIQALKDAIWDVGELIITTAMEGELTIKDLTDFIAAACTTTDDLRESAMQIWPPFPRQANQ